MSGGVWFLSFSKKKIEFKKYPNEEKNRPSVVNFKNKKSKSKNKNTIISVIIPLIFIFCLSLISADTITNDLHLNIQVYNSSGMVQANTAYDFAFNITSDDSCTTVVYSNLTTLTTDSRGIISYYLPDVTLDFDEQYWLCYYRDGSLINTSKLARTPYTFMAKNVTLSGVIVDTNLNMSNYNITNVSYGFFDWLGSLVDQVTTLFTQNIQFNGSINGSGNFTTTGRIGIGTEHPDEEMEIVGDLLASGAFQATGNEIIYAGSPLGQVKFYRPAGTNDIALYAGGAEWLRINGTQGNIGIGTATPEQTLDVVGTIQATGPFQTTGNEIIYAGSTLGQVKFYRPATTDDIALYAGGAERFRINGTQGNIGVNTTTPQNTMNVVGDLNVTGTIYGGNLSANDTQTLDGYDSAYFMPLNKSVVGNFSFNGGWGAGGVSIIDGDIYAQTGYFYNVTSLNVTQQNLSVIDDLMVFGNTWLNKNLSVDTDTLFVDSNTNQVGIGTTSPNLILDVVKSGTPPALPDGNGVARFTNTASNARIAIIAKNTASSIIDFGDSDDGDVGGIEYNHNTNALGFWTNTGANSLIIDSTGRVGIGTVSPQNKLQVNGTLKVGGASNQATGTIALGDDQSTGTNVGIFRGTTTGDVGGGNALILAGYDDIIFTSNGSAFGLQAERMRIDSVTGNVGIGTTSPTSPLYVNGTTNDGNNLIYSNQLGTGRAGFIVRDVASATRPVFSVSQASGTGGTQAAMDIRQAVPTSIGLGIGSSTTLGDYNFVVLGNGNVGINTTSPQTLLHIHGNGTKTGLFLERTANYGFSFDNVQQGSVETALVDFINSGSFSKSIMSWNELGNVGINTTTPQNTLNVIGTFNLTNISGSPVITTTADKNVSFDSGVFFYDAVSDKVGIGTTTPRNKLNVVGDINATVDIYGSRMYTSTGTADYPAYSFTSDTNTGMHSALGADILGFSTLGTTKLVIDSTGKVGINTTTPNGALDVNSPNAVLTAWPNLGVYTTDSFAIDKGGFVGIGGIYTGTTKTTFGGIVGRKETAVDGNYAGYLGLSTSVAGTGLTEKVRITSAGNVGIGTTTPQNALNVNGDINSTGTVYAQNTVNLSIGYGYATNGSLNDTYVPYMGAQKNVTLGDHNFSVNGSTLFVDANNSRVGIGTTGARLTGFSDEKLSITSTGTSTRLAIGNATNNAYFVVNQVGASLGTYYGNGALYFTIGGSTKVQIDTSGNFSVGATKLFVDVISSRVGVGTSSPQNALNVNGDINSTGTVYAQNTKNLSIGYDYATNGSLGTNFTTLYGNFTTLYSNQYTNYTNFTTIYGVQIGNASNMSTLYANQLTNWTNSTPYAYALNDSLWTLNYTNFTAVYGYAINGSGWIANYSDYAAIRAYSLNDSLWSLNYSNFTTLYGNQLGNASNMSTLYANQLGNASNYSTLYGNFTTLYANQYTNYTNSTGYGYATNGSYISASNVTYAYSLNDSLWSANYSNMSTGWLYAINSTGGSDTFSTNYTNFTAVYGYATNGSGWVANYSNVAFINNANTFGAYNQTFDTNLLFLNNNVNYVGIGTASPQNTLNVVGTFNVTNGTNSVQGLIVDSTNKIGIGTSSPVVGLSVNTTARFTGSVDQTAKNLDRIDIGVQTGSPRMVFENAGTANIWLVDNEAGVFRFYIPNYEQLDLSSTGNSPALSFMAAGSVAVIKFNASIGSNSYFNITGNLGVGTSTPQDKLNIVGGNLNMSNNTIEEVWKVTLNTGGVIDPPYKIDNVTYATYVPSIVGVKEEVSGIITLTSNFSVIDFGNLEKGTDLWLFYQITDFGKKMENLQVLLTPGFDGKVWYEKDSVRNTLTIFGSQPGEVSYRMTANRYDWTNWGKISKEPAAGPNFKEKK